MGKKVGGCYEIMLFWDAGLGYWVVGCHEGEGGGGSVYTCVRYQETKIISSLKLYSYILHRLAIPRSDEETH